MNIFENAKPCEAGVPDENMRSFFGRIENLPFCVHSVIMIRGQKVFAERYYDSFDKDTLQRMYSVTKSFVSLAVLSLASEGKISLDDYITTYFPEYPTPYEYTKKTTIRNMLMMRSPHDRTTYKRNLEGNWAESFFSTEPSHMPGTVFKYDSSASHTLGALVEKLADKPVLDYLRDKFLDKMGFSENAYCLTDPQGISRGADGLMATAMDIAKTAFFVMNGGILDGEQIISGGLIKEAISCLTATGTHGHFEYEKQGYGLQFWRTLNNGFMMYGKGGQIALCLPDKDFILVTTADSMDNDGGTQNILEIFWQEIYGSLN